jgi:hypothetical protein
MGSVADFLAHESKLVFSCTATREGRDKKEGEN